MKKLAALILLSIVINGCSSLSKPVPFGLYRGMRDEAPEGTETFRDGWKAGCHSGLAAYGFMQYKYAYSYTYDENMLGSDEYHNAWRLGFRHCRWYVAQWYRNDDDRQ